MQKPALVYIFPNGMLAVFDSNDKQILELQGPIFEIMGKLGEHADESTQFYMLGTATRARREPKNKIPMQVDWWFKKKRGK